MTPTRHLLRLVLRRDRFRLALWFLGLVILMAASVSSIVSLYATPQQLDSYARTARGNSALIIQAGPGYGLDHPTIGAVVMNETSLWMFVAVSVMSVFMSVRHTRTDEEDGRGELVRAAPVGRHAPLFAAVFGVAIANGLVAVGIVTALLAGGLPVVGSVAFGASLVGAGLVFGAIGVLGAQVASGSRAALATGAATIGVAFVLRAVGDVGNGVLSWASPLGWAQAVRAYAGERWWVLLLPAAATVGLLSAARAVQDRRDYGSGLIAPRRGRERATAGLSTPVGLAVRLQRGAFMGWCVGLGLLAFFYGLVADQAEKILRENPEVAEYFAQLGVGSVTDAFMSTTMLVVALFSTGFTVSSVLRMRTEELASRADPILAAPVSRRRWAGSHLALALVGSVALVALGGLAMGVGAGLALGDASQVVRLFGAGIVMAPAMWVVAAATFVLHGIRPRWSIAAWAFVAWAFVAGVFGRVLDLPAWALELSPFQHVPALPAAAMVWEPVIALTALAALLVVAGFVLLDRRDIA